MTSLLLDKNRITTQSSPLQRGREGRPCRRTDVLSRRCARSPGAHRSPCAAYRRPSAASWWPAEARWNPEEMGSGHWGSSHADCGKRRPPVPYSSEHSWKGKADEVTTHSRHPSDICPSQRCSSELMNCHTRISSLLPQITPHICEPTECSEQP